MKIVSSAKIKDHLQKQLKEKYPDEEFVFHPSIKEAEQDLADADVWISYGSDLASRHIEAAEKLSWLMCISAGIEDLPLSTLKEKGILVTNARGIHKIPMAEYTIATLLHVVKQMPLWYENQKKKDWAPKVRMGEITGKTMTIIGPGAIGEEIARLAKAFRMRTNGINRSGRAVAHIDNIYTFEQAGTALADADFVVSVLPHTPEADHLIGADHFKAMPDHALFVNIGRGKTVDEKALLGALQNKEIAHAILDVFEEEPLPEDHPFWEMTDTVTISPHFSSVTSGYQPRAFEIFERNLDKYKAGSTDLENKVNLDRGY